MAKCYGKRNVSDVTRMLHFVTVRHEGVYMLFLSDTPELNETDMQIYQCIVTHLRDIEGLSIRQLAGECHASTASILRFCRKFGTTGYSEFKIRLASYVRLHTEESNEAPELEDELLDFLSRFRDSFYRDRIDEAVSLLLEKELVLFLGLGTSNIIAEYGTMYFSSLFNMALRIEDPQNCPLAYLSPEIAGRTCVIALSVSGETQEVIDCISHINLSKSSVISITSTASSRIARLSDVNIPYFVSKEKTYADGSDNHDITTQVPALVIIERLAKQVRSAKEDASSLAAELHI